MLLISLFGIYAVATASTLRHRKEVAIRKVADADASTIQINTCAWKDCCK